MCFRNNGVRCIFKQLKKKNGSLSKLESYRGIFLVPILSLILEKLLKNRMQSTLENNMSKFQTRGAKGKGVFDDLFILRGLIDHTNYLGKELWTKGRVSSITCSY